MKSFEETLNKNFLFVEYKTKYFAIGSLEKVCRLWDISIDARGKFPIKTKYCLKLKVLCKYFLNPDAGQSMGSISWPDPRIDAIHE